MKPLFHPSVKDMTVEGVLHAFSDPVRVRIYVGILNAECAQSCSQFLKCDNRILPKSTLSQHFKILREAGLIRSERKGVELLNTTRSQETQPRFGPLIKAVIEAYAGQNQKSKSLTSH